jgi:hypothetical protein
MRTMSTAPEDEVVDEVDDDTPDDLSWAGRIQAHIDHTPDWIVLSEN